MLNMKVKSPMNSLNRLFTFDLDNIVKTEALYKPRKFALCRNL